jgi:thymidylate kinase
MSSLQDSSEPVIVSFSGLDGSGKTTQIAALLEASAHLGLRANLITFWDDVVVGTRWREGFVHKVFGSEQGVGAPGHPVERRDKNVRVGYLTLMRHLLYLADAIHLRIVLSRARKSGASVIIMDRYIYDELTNLPLENPFSMAYARLLARIAPRPELAILMDADPDLARARKPEYSLNFLRQSRRSYFRLAHRLGSMTIIPPLAIEEAKSAVLTSFLHILGKHRDESNLAGIAPA